MSVGKRGGSGSRRLCDIQDDGYMHLTSTIRHSSGLTYSRYHQLLFAWSDFLTEDRTSVNESRLGPDHDSWPAFEKKLASFQHYKIKSE